MMEEESIATLSEDALPKQLGSLYGALSAAHAAESARVFSVRAGVSLADARSESLSNSTRVAAAFDACAFVLLSRLARHGLVIEAMPEVVERFVACMVLSFGVRVAGSTEVLERHLGRYGAPQEFCDDDVVVALEVADFMLRDLLGADGGADAGEAMTPVLLEQSRSLPDVLALLARCTAPASVSRAELVARLEKVLELFEPSDTDEQHRVLAGLEETIAGLKPYGLAGPAC